MAVAIAVLGNEVLSGFGPLGPKAAGVSRGESADSEREYLAEETLADVWGDDSWADMGDPSEEDEAVVLDNSTLPTTCVATRLNAGHANNALPQTAQANINCRTLPGHSLEETRLELEKVVADPRIKVQFRKTSGALVDHAPDQRSADPRAPRKEVF
jgi:acetylornithine deacetylase/succinyl-diaminopimelate desuccinylase-like protein